jgi:hypothetical protein
MEMLVHSLERLRALALHAVKHPVLVTLARSESPTGAFGKATSLGWPKRQAKATRHLAQVRRDYGPEAFEASLIGEHARQKRTEQVRENKDMIYPSNERMSVEHQRLSERLQILRRETCRDEPAILLRLKKGALALADDVFLEFIRALHQERLPNEVFRHLSETSRPNLLAEIVLKCQDVLPEEVYFGKNQEKQMRARKLWWDAITLVLSDYGVEKYFQKYSSRPSNDDTYFFDILLHFQVYGISGPAELDKVIRDDFFGYRLNDDVMVQIKVDFEDYVKRRFPESPASQTRLEKIDTVARNIIETDMINSEIVQDELRKGGLNRCEGMEVILRAQEILRLKMQLKALVGKTSDD